MNDDITRIHREAILNTNLYRRFVSYPLVARLIRLILGPRIITTALPPELVRDRKKLPLYHLLEVKVENRPDPKYYLNGFFNFKFPQKTIAFLESITPNRSTGNSKVSIEFFNERGTIVSSVHYPERHIAGYSFEIPPDNKGITIKIAAMNYNGNSCWVYGSGPVRDGDRLVWPGNNPSVLNPLDESRRLGKGIHLVRIIIRNEKVLLSVSYFYLFNDGTAQGFRLLSAKPAENMFYLG